MADRSTKVKADILDDPLEVSVVADVGGSPTYATRLDEASATVTYVGKADIGSATASALWQIQKIDTSSGLVITWADGDALFDNVWNDRASLSYT
jgi:hypothetical protein